MKMWDVLEEQTLPHVKKISNVILDATLERWEFFYFNCEE